MTDDETAPLRGPWSYTRASACALALYNDKVLGLPPQPRPERLLGIDRTLLGGVLHLGASAYLRSVIGQPFEPDFPADDVLTAQARGGGVVSMADVARVLSADNPSLAAGVDEISGSLARFENRFLTDDGASVSERNARVRDRVLFCEHKIAVTADGRISSFDDCPEDGWRGKIDYAEDSGDGLLTVIDFKNRPAIFSDQEMREDEQLSCYLHMVSCHLPDFSRLAVGVYYFQYGVTRSVEIDRQQMLDNVARLRARARHKTSLAVGQIAPEPGYGKCQYCGYLADCPAGQMLLEPSLLVPTDMSSARATASWLVVTQEKVDAAKSALRAFTQEHGPVVVDDGTSVGFSAVERVRYDKDETLRVLKSLIDSGQIPGRLSQFTSLDTVSVKKAAARSEVVDRALDTARGREMVTEFNVFRSRKRLAVTPGSRKQQQSPRRVTGRVKSSRP